MSRDGSGEAVGARTLDVLRLRVQRRGPDADWLDETLISHTVLGPLPAWPLNPEVFPTYFHHLVG